MQKGFPGEPWSQLVSCKRQINILGADTPPKGKTRQKVYLMTHEVIYGEWCGNCSFGLFTKHLFCGLACLWTMTPAMVGTFMWHSDLTESNTYQLHLETPGLPIFLAICLYFVILPSQTHLKKESSALGPILPFWGIVTYCVFPDILPFWYLFLLMKIKFYLKENAFLCHHILRSYSVVFLRSPSPPADLPNEWPSSKTKLSSMKKLTPDW